MAVVRDPVAVWNERVKISAGFINAIGLGLIGFAVLRPLAEDVANVSSQAVWWSLTGRALHLVSHYILGLMRKASP